MDSRVWVPMQAVLVVVAMLLSYGVVGTAVALPLAIGGAVGTVVLVAFAGAYLLRRRASPQRVSGADAVMTAWAVGCLVVCPLAILLLDPLVRHDGVIFGGGVAVTWVFSGIVGCCVAIYASSLVDWFFILPRVCGMLAGAPAAWVTTGGASTAQRRRTAKIWVVHRGLAEIGVAVGLAVAISIAVVAVVSAVADDPMLSMAIESLGGTGVAVAILGFFGPRVRYGVRYMLGQIAGVGEWAEVRGPGGVINRGLVIDLSIDPGIRLHDEAGSQFFVPLRDCRLVQAAPGSRPPSCDEAWAYAQFASARESCRIADDAAPAESDDDAPEAIPEAVVG